MNGETTDKNGNARKIVPLKFPVSIQREGGGTAIIHQVEIGRLKGKHLKMLPESLFTSEKNIKPGEMIPFLMAITGLDEKTCNDVDFEDIVSIVEEMSSFFGLFRKETGG